MTIEIYVSTDIEADGPIPGPHSMLSIASAAYTAEKQLVATFSANLETLPGRASPNYGLAVRTASSLGSQSPPTRSTKVLTTNGEPESGHGCLKLP